ncbi:hypothetical protein DBP19_14260 [Streptomyces sp. CS090A]|uniref:hypothetical protein n=1 Tax=Streptomyces sp. CS090A TaxID=2162710 RepID=UPI000D522A5D|nr:hypothetical protein [Streptomyces sp. CS090A]PVC92876.1 hypothetical protein DBP19_14260 [Streptomyces sp. CS090A]
MRSRAHGRRRFDPVRSGEGPLRPTAFSSVRPNATAAPLLLRHSSDRYTSTPDAARYFGAYVLACLVLASSGLTLEWGFDVRWAIAGAGLVAGVLTVVMGHRVDATVRRELRAGR